MSSAAPFDGASDETTVDEIREGFGGNDAADPPRYAPGVGKVPAAPPLVDQVPVPPPVVVQPRVYASPPPQRQRGEWRVLWLALFIAGLLLLCFCLAGYAVFLNGGFGASE